MSALDVSPRVNDHITQMVIEHAAARLRDSPAADGAVRWTPEMLGYFGSFGDRIGSLRRSRSRHVSARYDFARLPCFGVVDRISAHDVNIAAQMLRSRS